MKYVNQEIVDESGTRIGDFLVPVDDIEDAEEFQGKELKKIENYLRKNLQIEFKKKHERDYNDEYTVIEVNLKLGDEIISSDSISI